MKKSILSTILIAGTLFVNSGTASAATVVYLDGTVTQVPDALVIGNSNFTQNFDGTYSSTYELTAGKPAIGTLDPATAAKYLPGYSNTPAPQPVETPAPQPVEVQPTQPAETPAPQPVETPAPQPVEASSTNKQNTTSSSSETTSSETKTESSTEVKTETKSEVKTESSKPSSAQISTKKVDNLPKTNDSSIIVPILGTVALAFSTLAYSLKKNKKFEK